MAVRLDNGGEGPEEIHDINVTPFIDVILVLLIIFMVAAPLSTVDVAVDLPAAAAKPANRPAKPVFLTIKADRSFAISEEAVAKPGMVAALLAAVKHDTSQRIYLRADKSVPYGVIMETMMRLNEAGLRKVSLVALEKAP
ncbi:MAG: TonB system transport protein ExbD [Hyphomicrobiaceae bacterium]